MSAPSEQEEPARTPQSVPAEPEPEPEEDHRKPCTLCSKACDVRIRCQIDKTGTWHFVCPGKCWTAVSGGVIDGDKDPAHKYYRYGGVWKNKHDAVSGKKPKKTKKQKERERVREASEAVGQ